MLRAQRDWFDDQSRDSREERTEGIPDFTRMWRDCHEQLAQWQAGYTDWLSTASSATPDEQVAAEALNHMLDPRHFMQFGTETMSLLFNRLAEIPQFADIGVLEKKLLHTGKEWQAFQAAYQHYHEVLAHAWQRAWQVYADDFSSHMDQNASFQDWLDRWLETADRELVETLRSPAFLKAQRQLFSTGIAFKKRQDRLVESLSEACGIPTRSELDDLHTLVYELRRELRQLKRQLSTQKEQAAPEPPPAKRQAASHGKTPGRQRGGTR